MREVATAAHLCAFAASGEHERASITTKVCVADSMLLSTPQQPPGVAVRWGARAVRLVVVRDFPGHKKDDVFVSTDPSLPARHIIESFSKRWSLSDVS